MKRHGYQTKAGRCKPGGDPTGPPSDIFDNLAALRPWFEPIGETATAIQFVANRLSFHRPGGARQPANSGSPPILVAR